MNFKIDMKTVEKEVPVIALEGEVDVYTAPQLKQRMISLLESGARELVVNLTKVDYLDSTALGVLIGGLKRIREADGNMVLVCPSPASGGCSRSRDWTRYSRSTTPKMRPRKPWERRLVKRG